MEMSEIKNIVGILVKRYFDGNQDRLAEKMGVTQQAVSRWMGGGGMKVESQNRLKAIWEEYQSGDMMRVDQVMTKDEARLLVDDILDSQSLIFKTALTVSARAYHKAVEGEREVEGMKTEIAGLKSEMSSLKQELGGKLDQLIQAFVRASAGAKREITSIGQG